MGNSRRQKPFPAVLYSPALLRTVAVSVRLYDDKTLQTEMPISEEQVISIFVEKNVNGQWLFSFWVLGPGRQEQESVNWQFLSRFWDEYSLLFSACVKALLQLENNLALMSKIRICSYDTAIERNFLSQWNGEIGDDSLRIELLDQRPTQALRDLSYEPLNHRPQSLHCLAV
jgi:hypothetical protein